MSSARPHATTRVVKRLAPDQPGALRHARRFGDKLVCVRYRHDLEAHRRYTTVELIVDEAPIRDPRQLHGKAIPMVAIRLVVGESTLRQSLQAHGGLWDNATRLWYVRLSTAKALGLLDRVV